MEPIRHSENISHDIGELIVPQRDPGLATIGHELLARLPAKSIHLRHISKTVSVADLREQFPEGRIIACDFAITDIEHIGRLTSYGYEIETENIANIDHHARHPSMYRPVSSGNLAIDYVQQFGAVDSDTPVVIHHTDCDSVISSLVMAGLIPPDPVFGDAVIAADHTGEAHPISDLLQAIEKTRDLNHSAEQLGRYLTGQPLSKSSQRFLADQIEGRRETAEAILDGDALKQAGPLSVVHLTGRMKNYFMPAILPDAVVILTFEDGKQPDTTVIRARLGKAAPEGFHLITLDVEGSIDAHFGGRWNAGSNKRGGGTTEDLEQYILRFQKRFDEVLSEFTS